MGAWGYEPLDSDAALDWLPEVTDPAGRAVSVLLDNFEEKCDLNDNNLAATWFAHELRAAAHVVERLNFFPMQYDDLYERLADALKIVRDSTWPDEWDEPDAVRAAVQKQIDKMEAGFEPTSLIQNFGA